MSQCPLLAPVVPLYEKLPFAFVSCALAPDSVTRL